jgi:hypothetical protein
MDTAEVVMHEMQGNCASVVFNLLGERVSKPSETPHFHSHGQVLPFCVARGNMTRVWSAADYSRAAANAFRRTILCVGLTVTAIQFDQHRVIDVCTERTFHGIYIYAMTVRGKLNAMGHALREIINESASGAYAPRSDTPTWDKLRVSADRRPGPNVAIAELPLHPSCKVFGFGVTKRPDFVALNPLTGKVSQRVLLILFAGVTEFDKKLHYGVLGHASHSDGRSNGVSFHKSGNNLHTLLCSEFVHADHYA